MNNYGVVLSSVGMAPFMTAFQSVVAAPIAALLYPDVGRWLDSHHAFSVRYKVKKGGRGVLALNPSSLNQGPL